MKKLLPTIGLYLGTFIVLNVAMFFLLKMTQPAPSPSELALGQDSTAHDSSHAVVFDSLAVDPPTAHHNETPDSAHTDSAIQGIDHDTSDVVAATEEMTTDGAEHVSDEASDSTQVTEQTVTDAPNADAEVDSSLVNEQGTDSKGGEEIAKLAKVLEGMKPGEAAVIAERLPTDTIVELVMRMKARTGAKMMASLPVPVAASVASRMAELSGAKRSS